MFVFAGQGGIGAFLPVRGDIEQVIPEQTLVAFQYAAAVCVPLKLHYRLAQRVGAGRRFTFHDHQGQAIDEQCDIWDDVLICAGDINLELRYRQEAIVCQVVEIDIANGGASFPN